MMKYLPLFPCLRARDILKRPDYKKLRLLFYKPDLVPTYSGTTALSLAARSLKKLDRTHILVPSFNCGHEIEPFLRENFKIDMYRINRYGKIDFDHLTSQLTGRRQVVLVTHFFGFPQPIEEIRQVCKNENVYVLEDCAHSFLSTLTGKPLGSWGDLSIYSYRKTLPSPDGGGLMINNPDMNFVLPSCGPNAISVMKKTAELIINQLLTSASFSSPLLFKLIGGIRHTLMLVQLFIQKGLRQDSLHLYSPDNESYEYNSDILDWKMSELSLRVIANCNLRQIRKLRIRNYQYVEKAIKRAKRIRPLFPYLPEGTCPLRFPFIGPENCDEIHDVMAEYPHLLLWWPQFHPGVEWHDFSDSVWLKRNCYFLSIHQDMNKLHLDFLIDCVLEVDRKLCSK